MIKHFDPTSPVLMTYLASINPNDETGFMLAKPNENTSKKSRRSRKGDKSTTKHSEQVSKTTTEPVETAIVDTHTKTIPLKSSVLKRIQKKAHPFRKSPERSSSFSPSFTHKPHVTRKGVIICEVKAPVPPYSKKRGATDMAKHISKKIKKRKLVLEKTPVIPLEVSLTKSSHEEVRNSDILTHVSDTDVNVTLGEGDSNIEHPMITQGSFDDLKFDLEEEDIPYHMLMSGKKFKILNKKLKSILQSQADAGGGNFVSSVELDVMLKAQEARLFNKLFGLIQASESRILEKVDELREDMSKEIAITQQDYASFNQKIDIIADAVTKFVKLYDALHPRLAQFSTHESKSLTEITTLLNELKSLISKPGSSPLITPEFLSQKFLLFESVLHKQLAPLSRIVSLLPTNAPPVVTGVQGGE
ncbi:unnamed protein product [Lactuca saligna]|uniref:Uncharacterized protein n=1 Tax=Lactuca saligna TaxID=75948 RepID=A0AA35YU16_LACSI|nr:unnamed protein product [Lactuca saligna]